MIFHQFASFLDVSCPVVDAMWTRARLGCEARVGNLVARCVVPRGRLRQRPGMRPRIPSSPRRALLSPQSGSKTNTYRRPVRSWYVSCAGQISTSSGILLAVSSAVASRARYSRREGPIWASTFG
jgi:hypothetical protein